MTSWIMTSNKGVNVVEIKTIIPHLFLCYHQIYKQIFSFKLTQSQDTKHQDLDNHQKCLSKCSSNHAPIFCVIIKFTKLYIDFFHTLPDNYLHVFLTSIFYKMLSRIQDKQTVVIQEGSRVCPMVVIIHTSPDKNFHVFLCYYYHKNQD